jgi:hypothetical protein
MMTSDQDRNVETVESVGQIVKRRGLFAAMAGLVAGTTLKYFEEPVQAATANVIYSTTGPGSLPNDVGSSVLLEPGAGLSANGPVVQVQQTSSNPTTCIQAVIGLVGAPGTAVNAIAGSGIAVDGQSDSGIGVRGQIASYGNSNAIAVYGLNNSSYAGPGPGAGGFGVYGLSAKGHGLVGATAAAGAAAVVGATNGVAGAYAAAFYGPVIVGGALTVFGAKSAAVPHPDGSHRRLYCVESPESWFEDFGKGQLECGEAQISFDPDFAAVVNLEDYHVFLTQYDGHDDLCVTDQTSTGFRVQAREAASLSRFSWRVVAKRKDIEGPRFETVAVPREPALPSIPELPSRKPPTVARV